MPSRARANVANRVMSRSPSATVPLSGGSRPVSALKHVVFPAPFGPMRDVISPAGTSSDKSLTATRPPKRLEISVATSRPPRSMSSLRSPLIEFRGLRPQPAHGAGPPSVCGSLTLARPR